MTFDPHDMQMGTYRRVYQRWLDGRRINRVPLEAEALLVRLMLLADDFGNLRGEPFVLRSTAFPARAEVTTEQTESWLAALEQHRLVRTYDRNGERYIHLLHFRELQLATGKSRHPLQRCPREPVGADDAGQAALAPPSTGARSNGSAHEGAPTRNGAHHGAAGRSDAPNRTRNRSGTEQDQSSTPTHSPGSAPNDPPQAEARHAEPPKAAPRPGGGGGGGARRDGFFPVRYTGDERDAFEKAWNGAMPRGWRIAGSRDSSHLAEALDDLARWERAPDEAQRDPLGWLTAQALAYLASGEAKRTRNTLGAWLRKRKWQETPEQWNSGDDGPASGRDVRAEALAGEDGLDG